MKKLLAQNFGALLLCLGLLMIFGRLSQEVLEKEAFGFDTSILLWLHQHTNSTLDSLMMQITRLGDPEIVVVLVTIAFSLLIWQRQFWSAQMLFLACLGGLILNQGLKLVFAKPRPQLWTPLVVEHSYSFPSGHALGGLVVYGFLAVLLAYHFPRLRYGSSPAAIYGIAAVIVGAIGISRLFLGVHWPTDILAGYTVGAVWLMACIFTFRLVHSHYHKAP